MDKILSVIVPMYNVEPYIMKCLNSFVQEPVDAGLEVLIINDGATDDSARLAESFAARYSQTFRVINQENGGHGAAINRGITEAAGKYLKVVDGDDWVDGNALTKFLSRLRQTDADVVITHYRLIDDLTGKGRAEYLYRIKSDQYNCICSFEELPKGFCFKMHALTFKTSILKKMPYRLDEHCYYVDTEYSLFPLPLIETMIFYPICLYRYRVGMKTQSVDTDVMRKRCSQHERVLTRLLDFYHTESDSLSKIKCQYLANGISRIAVSQYRIWLSFPVSPMYRQKIIELEYFLKMNYPQIYRTMKHPAIWLLRATRYRLYPAVSLLVQQFYR